MANISHASNFLNFISSISNHRRLVFADEKPMKEKMIYGKVRRDVQKGTTPAHKCKSVNSKNALNILTAVNIKGGGVPPVYSKVLDTVKTNASVFIHFVRLLLVRKVLVRGDFFIVDNCTVHLKGDNIGIQEELFQNHGILMITLPPTILILTPRSLFLLCSSEDFRAIEHDTTVSRRKTSQKQSRSNLITSISTM